MERIEPVALSELRTLDGCRLAIDRLMEMPPAAIAHNDIALLNLVCTPTLLGSENLNILECLGRLGNVTAFVANAIERNRESIQAHPDYDCAAMQCMALLVMKVKRDFGVAYSPTAKTDLEAGINAPFTDSSEVFIHGMLRADQNRRWGTCSSIPVLITAIARRLGFPVRLAVNRNHVFCRWDDGNGTCFNIEASNPEGMTVDSDEHYRTWPKPLTAEELRSGHFVRSLTPAEEFALFLKFRVHCLIDAGWYDATFRWTARALQYAPDDPNSVKDAYRIVDTAIKHRHWKKFPNKKLPSCDAHDQPFMMLGQLLEGEEMSPYLTIMGHVLDAQGKQREARKHFEDACRYANPAFNEHRDLQRFLKKHDLKPKRRPLLWPQDCVASRFFRLSCPPQEEADMLRRLADRFEQEGELLKAHDALRDLYLYDPGDNEVFWRARSMEDNPWYQTQLNAQLKNCQQFKQQTKRVFTKFNGMSVGTPPNTPGPLKVNSRRKEQLWLTVRQ